MRKTMMLLVVASALAQLTPAQTATVVLTFDQANSCVFAKNLNSPAGPCTFNGQNISPTYGSTPELAVTYKNFDGGGALSQSNLNWTDEGFGQGSAYATGSNGPPEDLEFIFTPASGFEVSLSSVETWVNSGVTPVLATYTSETVCRSPEIAGVHDRFFYCSVADLPFRLRPKSRPPENVYRWPTTAEENDDGLFTT